MYYPSLVIIFIKRTDRSQKRYFLWQILERDREGLGGGRWRRMPGPHTGGLGYWQSQISAEIRNWESEETTNKLDSFLSETEIETSPVRSDILIKTFQSDTSQFSGLHTIILSHHQLVSQDKHPDTVQSGPADRREHFKTDRRYHRQTRSGKSPGAPVKAGEQSYKVELELLTGSPRYLVRNCFQISLPGW